MEDIRFLASEYTSDGNFASARYQYKGSARDGWSVSRNQEALLALGPGYEAVRVERCGVCSTDLARRFLPYPLPQVIGHEMTGFHEGRRVVVEINASHKSRGLDSPCPFCRAGLDTQCPERITLGINQLPGGFGSWVLAPKGGIVAVPAGVDPLAAALVEPFAAALHGVKAAAPRDGEVVAVLGPRRLGLLTIAALAAWRAQTGRRFEIQALSRHESLLTVAQQLGADLGVDLNQVDAVSLEGRFDVVFDTTGSPAGLATALSGAKRLVHLKSTHGRQVMGLDQLTALVVDELTLLPGRHHHLHFQWPFQRRERGNVHIWVSPKVPDYVIESELVQTAVCGETRVFHRLPVAKAYARLSASQAQWADAEVRFPKDSDLPRFDAAIVADWDEVDTVIRPNPEIEMSLVRPRGAILVWADQAPAEATLPLHRAVCERGVALQSSRCGDFHDAVALLAEQPQLAAALVSSLVTHVFPADELAGAFEMAADSTQSIKVLVNAGMGLGG